MKTIKVMPWGEDQGEFVLINEEDFNPDVHELFGEKKLTAKEKKAIEAAAKLLEATKEALKAKNIEFDEASTQEELQALLDAAE